MNVEILHSHKNKKKFPPSPINQSIIKINNKLKSNQNLINFIQFYNQFYKFYRLNMIFQSKKSIRYLKILKGSKHFFFQLLPLSSFFNHFFNNQISIKIIYSESSFHKQSIGVISIMNKSKLEE